MKTITESGFIQIFKILLKTKFFVSIYEREREKNIISYYWLDRERVKFKQLFHYLLIFQFNFCRLNS